MSLRNEQQSIFTKVIQWFLCQSTLNEDVDPGSGHFEKHFTFRVIRMIAQDELGSQPVVTRSNATRMVGLCWWYLL